MLPFVIGLEIVPAKLMMTLFARDVIASSIFYDDYSAHGAVLSTFLFLPDLELFLLLAFATRMNFKCFCTALETNICAALALN